MNILLNWILSAVVILVAAYIVPGITVPTFWTALIVALVLGIVNAVIKPILIVLTLPINVLTLGLFTIVINTLLIMLVSKIVPTFGIAGFWYALLFGIVLSIINIFVHGVFGNRDMLDNRK